MASPAPGITLDVVSLGSNIIQRRYRRRRHLHVADIADKLPPDKGGIQTTPRRREVTLKFPFGARRSREMRVVSS